MWVPNLCLVQNAAVEYCDDYLIRSCGFCPPVSY